MYDESLMLGLAHPHLNMTDPEGTYLSIPDQVLEDGEIDDDDEEVVTEETEVVEETIVESVAMTREESGSEFVNPDQFDRSDGTKNETDDQEVYGGDDRKKSHRRHQRKRKRHRDSKEREPKAEKKGRRRNKRKLHGNDDGTESHENGDSLSPHSKRRKKRKKHSRDRESTTPDSEESVEEYPQSYYSSSNGYSNEYGSSHTMYSSKSMYRTTADQYYSASSSRRYSKKDTEDYGNDSGSDFEAQLAEYKNYKTHGDSYSKEPDKDEKKNEKSGMGGEMYEEFMEYEENPKRVCKFFLEGKCLKGNECSFSHDQSARKGKKMKREICRYYLAGHCHHGNQCSYMHGDYPCKYFHTGVTCYAGEKCRFSHKPATDETQEIIDNFKDVLSNVDDSWEIRELAKVGITVKPKPPPGVGLLPTPDVEPMTEKEQSSVASVGSGKLGTAIPSIFDISVAPTAEFQKRISQNNVASLSMNEQTGEMAENGTSQLPPQMYPTPKNWRPKNNGVGLLPTPNTLPMNLNASQQGGGSYRNFDAMRHGDNRKLSSEGNTESEDVITPGEDFIPADHSAADSKQTVGGVDTPLEVPEFLPATQKALFMRIHGKKVTADQDKGSNQKNAKRNTQDSWTYSSDEDEKPKVSDAGVIKMDADSHVSTTNASSSSSTMESLLKMIRKGSNPGNVDASLLSKVASVINMPTPATDTYTPTSSIATYNPAQSKVSPRRPSTTQRERKDSGSISSSPVHPTRHQKPTPIRRRLSTQELSKEPVSIPLVAKQAGNQPMHSTHPDPRITLSRLVGNKSTRFTANLPKFSKDLILPTSSQIINMKVTLISDEPKVMKRDPRLGRQKDPRLQKSIDPRLKTRTALKSSTGNTVSITNESRSSSTPSKPSALLTKSSSAIPSLPELDLNLAYIQQASKENSNNHVTSSITKSSVPPYPLPTLKLPRLVKAPNSSTSPTKEPVSDTPQIKEQPIAPYDPRYMSSNTTDSPEIPIPTAPYDPRVLTGQSGLSSGGDIKKRTIQLPKLTPAPLYKPSDALPALVRPEGDQGDF